MRDSANEKVAIVLDIKDKIIVGIIGRSIDTRSG